MDNFNNCNGDPSDTLIFSSAPPPTWIDGENNIDWRKMYENKCNHNNNNSGITTEEYERLSKLIITLSEKNEQLRSSSLFTNDALTAKTQKIIHLEDHIDYLSDNLSKSKHQDEGIYTKEQYDECWKQVEEWKEEAEKRHNAILELTEFKSVMYNTIAKDVKEEVGYIVEENHKLQMTMNKIEKTKPNESGLVKSKQKLSDAYKMINYIRTNDYDNLSVKSQTIFNDIPKACDISKYYNRLPQILEVMDNLAVIEEMACKKGDPYDMGIDIYAKTINQIHAIIDYKRIL